MEKLEKENKKVVGGKRMGREVQDYIDKRDELMKKI